MSESAAHAGRSYGCTYGCGNPYDVLLVSVADGTTEFLCLPCLVKLAADMVTGIINAESANVDAKVRKAGTVQQAPMDGNGARPRGHNAPVTTDDPDLFAAFDAVITADELPEQFR